MSTVFLDGMEEAQALYDEKEFINAVVMYVEKVANAAFPTAYPCEVFTSEHISVIQVPSCGLTYDVPLTPSQIKRQNNGIEPLSIVVRCKNAS